MRAAPLREHLRQAEGAWDRLRDGLRLVTSPILAELRDEVRRDACRSFWLYPLVEARRGLP